MRGSFDDVIGHRRGSHVPLARPRTTSPMTDTSLLPADMNARLDIAAYMLDILRTAAQNHCRVTFSYDRHNQSFDVEFSGSANSDRDTTFTEYAPTAHAALLAAADRMPVPPTSSGLPDSDDACAGPLLDLLEVVAAASARDFGANLSFSWPPLSQPRFLVSFHVPLGGKSRHPNETFASLATMADGAQRMLANPPTS